MIFNERGFSIIEHLIALLIISTAAISSIPILALSYNATSASKSHAAMLSEVEQIVTSYKTQPLITTLKQISSSPTSLVDGDSVTLTKESLHAKASFSITLTAIKGGSSGSPEAVKVKIEVEQRRGKLGNQSLVFETIISQLG